MTNEKKIIEAFISLHSEYEPIKNHLSVSLYGDILDVRRPEKERVIAISDLPHDLLAIGYSDMPNNWTVAQ